MQQLPLTFCQRRSGASSTFLGVAAQEQIELDRGVYTAGDDTREQTEEEQLSGTEMKRRAALPLCPSSDVRGHHKTKWYR
jgi:hypothetical protein